MKKHFNFLIIALFGFILFPTLVNAATLGVVKEFNDKVYVIEEDKTFTCSLNQDSVITIIPYKNYFVFREIGEPEEYKYNIETEVCTLMNENDQNERTIYNLTNFFEISYKWESDNKIYKTQNRVYEEGYIKTEDTTIDENKTYYRLVSETMMKLYPEDLDEEMMEEYYEKYYFVNNTFTTQNEDTEYYLMIDNENYNLAEKQSTWELPFSIYYVTISEEDLFNTTYVLTADFDDFDKTPVEGVTITKDMLSKVINVNGKSYLVFTYSIEDEISRMFIYNDAGEVIVDKDNKVIEVSNIDTAFNNNIIYKDYINDEIFITDYEFTNIYNFESSIGFSNEQYNIEKNNFKIFLYHNGESTVFNRYLKITTYELLEGSNQKYNDNNLVFKFSGELNKLNKVKVDGTEIDSNNYTTASGSTIITLKNDYLKTLKPGSHTLTVEYNDKGYSNAAFTVNEKNPQTFDGIITYIILGMISIFGLTAAIYSKKKKLN